MSEEVKEEVVTKTETEVKSPEEKRFTQADIDRAVSQAIQSREKNLRAELKDYYTKEAQKQSEMTAEERAQEIVKKFEEQMRERERLANVREAEVELKNAKFSEEEIAFYTSDITNDRDVSMAKIQKICEFRKRQNDLLTKEFNERMASQVGKNLSSGSTDETALQSNYNEAKKQGNIALMSAIVREAHDKKIILKQ